MREILRTGEQAAFEWPEDVFLQGGKSGAVFSPNGNYRTAFVEAFPGGTFLRGEGETVAEAEAKCWEKYQRHLKCSDGTGQHGPYDPRKYENGAGFCVKCGAWFTKVCEPSQAYRIGELACERVQARWGKDVVLLHKWSGLVEDEKASIRAELAGEPPPAATTEDPTEDELREAAAPLDFSTLEAVLNGLKDVPIETGGENGGS